MLPLDSPRWNSFDTYFDTPQQIPKRLASWLDAIGAPEEESQWADVSEQFLHQGTITDAAYAAVPHVVRGMRRMDPRRRLDYLVPLGLVESARQYEGAPALPHDLAAAYDEAVAEARRFAVECLSLDLPKVDFRHLLSAVSNLHGHGVLGHLIFNLDSLSGQCPKCGKYVYPDEIQTSGYA